MSVTVTDPISEGYIPNGVTTDFAFDFKIATAAEISVFQVLDGVATEVDPADYEVTLAVDGEGGTVSFDAAPATGSGSIYLVSDPLFTQTVAFGAEGPFTPTTVGGALDKAAIRDVYLNAHLARALKVPIDETGPELLSAANRAEHYLAFDENGDPVNGVTRAAVTQMQTDIVTNATAIAAETAARIADVDTEEAARIAAIDAEAAARAAADTALDTRLDTQEALAGRVVRAPSGEAMSDLQPIAARAGKLAAWDSQGQPTSTALGEVPLGAELPLFADSRIVLAAFTGMAASQAAYLSEDNRSGTFVWSVADLSAEVTADPDELAYVPSASDTTGASGAWVRRSGALILDDIEVTVGTAGDFSTLNAAITHLSNSRARYKREGVSATIRILDDGWTMAEQVIANNAIDLGWIEIVSDQASVTISRAALVETSDTVPGFDFVDSATAAFMAANGAVLPRIGCVFAFDNSGVAGTQHGIFVTKGATAMVSAGCGINDAPGLGAYIIYGAHLIAPESEWSGNGTSLHSFFAGGVRADWVGFVSLQQANIHDNPGQGVMINGASVCSLRDATIANSGSDGLQTGGCSIVHARGLSSTGNAGRGIFADEGSSVRLLSSTITGNGGVGVWVDTGARVNSASGTVISINGTYGVRCLRGGRFVAVALTCQNNTSVGISAEGGDVFLSGGTISGHPAGDDLVADGSDIRLTGAVTTSSGNTVANNLADSNVAAFNVPRSGGQGGIYGRGGKAFNRGTASIGSGATSVAVTHGVDFAPQLSEVSVTPTNSLGAATKFWISNMTATQFTINVDAAPGVTATFGWTLERIVG